MSLQKQGALFSLLFLFACSVDVEPDSKSGEDGESSGAKQLFLDKLTDDFLSAEDGDATDWKYFKLREPGYLTVTVCWDNKNIASTIDIYDAFKVPIDSRLHTPKMEKDKMEVRAEDGTHFVRLQAKESESVYTIEAKFQPFDWKGDTGPKPVGGGAIILDEFPSDPISVRDRRRPGIQGGRRPSGGRKTARPVAKIQAIQGTIVRVTPGARKRSTVLSIRIGVQNHGVKKGAQGEIMDGSSTLKGGRFQIMNVRGQIATAETHLKKNQIAHHRRVRIFSR